MAPARAGAVHWGWRAQCFPSALEFRRGGYFCYCAGFVSDQGVAAGGGKATRTGLCPCYRLERAAGFRREDTGEQRLDKLEAVLAQATNDLDEAAPLLAALLSPSTGDRYPPLNLTPQKQKDKTLQALVAQVEGLAARQPVLMLFEDAQWIDPTSLELLDLIIDRLPGLPVLLIITFRPEFNAPWIGRPHVTSLTLNRLAPGQRAEMIAGVTGGKALPKGDRGANHRPHRLCRSSSRSLPRRWSRAAY
jgi:hypothetical protein